MTPMETATAAVREYLIADGYCCECAFAGMRIGELIVTKNNKKRCVIVIPRVAYEYYDDGEATKALQMQWATELSERCTIAESNQSVPFGFAYVEMTEACEQLGEIVWDHAL